MLNLLDGVILTLQQNLSPGDTSIKVSTADALKLNRMAVGDATYLTISDQRGIETMKYTHAGVIAASPGTVVVPVERAQFGTTARTWPKNSCLSVRLTQNVLDLFVAQSIAKTFSEATCT